MPDAVSMNPNTVAVNNVQPSERALEAAAQNEDNQPEVNRTEDNRTEVARPENNQTANNNQESKGIDVYI